MFTQHTVFLYINLDSKDSKYKSLSNRCFCWKPSFLWRESEVKDWGIVLICIYNINHVIGPSSTGIFERGKKNKTQKKNQKETS